MIVQSMDKSGNICHLTSTMSFFKIVVYTDEIVVI
jgi:hypothetical protein